METIDSLEAKTNAAEYRHWGKHGISAFGLKLIACFAMLIDHIKYILYNPFLKSIGISNELFRLPSLSEPYNVIGFCMGVIGRLALPVFAFQITEGYVHTKNKWKYLARLAAFALLSEIPFDVGFFGQPFYWGKQNVFFTLALGLLSIILFDTALHSSLRPKWLNVPVRLFAVVGCGILADAIRSDYGFMGVILILVLYAFRDKPLWRDILFAALMLLPLFQAGQYFAVLCIPLFHLYNGKKGYSAKAVQTGFYLFYPVHILLLRCGYILIWG